MLKILNFVFDEKFIDGTIEYLSTTPDETAHDYIHVSETTIGNFQLIRRHPDIIIQMPPEQIMDFVKEKQYDVIFLHSLYSCPLDLIAKFPTTIKVCWFGWGYDMYSEDDSQIITMPLYKSHTKYALGHHWRAMKRCIQKWLHIPSNEDNSGILYRKAVQRIDFFSGVLPVEYELAQRCSFFKAKPVEYHYYGVLPYQFATINGNNIIIGNSADPLNNHLDLIEYIEKLQLDGRRVYMPLSYAGFPAYIKKVKKAFEDKIGENFIPLESFLNSADYFDIMNSCSVGIFFHERQQAIGNINQILRNGGKVFLSETSVAYQYLSSIGARVFSVQKDLCDTEINKPLSVSEKETNRRLTTPTLEYKISLLKTLYHDIQEYDE